MSDWPKPCIAEFERLAESDPDMLVSWIRSGALADGHLTHALSALGDAVSEKDRLLVGYLTHSSPVVREGAVLGLSATHTRPIAAALREALRAEDSLGVVATIQDVLEGWGGDE